MFDTVLILLIALNMLASFLKWFSKKPVFETRYESRADMLYAYTHGEILTVNDLLSHAWEVDQEAARNGNTKVYNDLLETTFTTDIVVYSELIRAYVGEMALPAKDYKIACLIRKEFTEPGRFWEMACQNRGIKARVFFEEKEAMDWLRQ